MQSVQGIVDGKDVVLPPMPRKNGRFTILFTGDFHSHLEPSASIHAQKPLGGAVRIARYIETCRRTTGHPFMVLDAGDFLKGTLYYEQFKGKAEVQFMNEAGYGIVTIGNHDLDDGLDHLQDLLKEGKFTKICANIFREGNVCFTPFSCTEIGGVRVGVVGIMGTDAWQSIRPSRREGLMLEDPSVTLDKLLPELRPQVDVIVLLSHSGIKQDRVFAEKHPLVDIIIGGHSHTFMKQHEQHRHVALFHAAAHGHLMGKMEVEVRDDEVIKRSSVEFMDERFDAVYEEGAVSSMITLLDRFKITGYNEVLLHCTERLSNEGKLERLIPLGVAICEVLRKAAKVDVAVIPSGAINTGIEPGPFTVTHVHELLSHKEALWVVPVKGSYLLQLLQEGQNRWGKPRGFQYSGISFEVKDSLITQATIQERQVNPDLVYTIAGPSFFFEREIMEGSEVRLHLQNQVQKPVAISPDLREDFVRVVRSEGLF